MSNVIFEVKFCFLFLKFSQRIQSISSSFEGIQIMELANDKLDEHLKTVDAETHKMEIKEYEVIFAFFARHLIDQCREVLGM